MPRGTPAASLDRLGASCPKEPTESAIRPFPIWGITVDPVRNGKTTVTGCVVKQRRLAEPGEPERAAAAWPPSPRNRNVMIDAA